MKTWRTKQQAALQAKDNVRPLPELKSTGDGHPFDVDYPDEPEIYSLYRKESPPINANEYKKNLAYTYSSAGKEPSKFSAPIAQNASQPSSFNTNQFRRRGSFDSIPGEALKKITANNTAQNSGYTSSRMTESRRQQDSTTSSPVVRPALYKQESRVDDWLDKTNSPVNSPRNPHQRNLNYIPPPNMPIPSSPSQRNIPAREKEEDENSLRRGRTVNSPSSPAFAPTNLTRSKSDASNYRRTGRSRDNSPNPSNEEPPLLSDLLQRPNALTGFLQKQSWFLSRSSKIKPWRTRYAVLVQNELHLFRTNSPSEKAYASMPITSDTTAQAQSSLFIIDIKCPAMPAAFQIWRLRYEQKEDMIEWLSSFKRAIDRSRATSKTPDSESSSYNTNGSRLGQLAKHDSDYYASVETVSYDGEDPYPSSTRSRKPDEFSYNDMSRSPNVDSGYIKFLESRKSPLNDRYRTSMGPESDSGVYKIVGGRSSPDVRTSKLAQSNNPWAMSTPNLVNSPGSSKAIQFLGINSTPSSEVNYNQGRQTALSSSSATAWTTDGGVTSADDTAVDPKEEIRRLRMELEEKSRKVKELEGKKEKPAEKKFFGFLKRSNSKRK